jgi:Fe-S-cluster-containing dehydrogenase component
MKSHHREPGSPPDALSRRLFFQRVGTMAVGTAAVTLGPQDAESAPGVSPLPTLPAGSPENLLLRMQADVRRAMGKPLEQRRWAMGIDVRKCVGCSACTVACAVENKLPPGMFYRVVSEETTGEFPDVRRRFFPRPCLHCDQPPCVEPCPVTPVKATRKRPDGIVEIDYEACIGCGLCVDACPYGARALDNGDFYTDATPRRQAYESAPAWEYGHERRRDGSSPPVAKARKCHLCLHRLEAGMLPACVATCICNGVYVGDLNDPASLVSELAKKPGVMRLREELGTKPSVFHIV